MTERKGLLFWAAGVFTAAFCFCGVVLFGSYRWCEGLFYERMAAVAGVFPGSAENVMRALKGASLKDLAKGKEILGAYGYYGRLPGEEPVLFFLGGSLLTAGICAAVIFLFLYRERKWLRKRAEELTVYLREVEQGNDCLFPGKGQDMLSNLEDEIYKTVLALKESREAAAREKENLAKNLADISHQFKTPLTSLSVLGELLSRRVTGKEERAVVRKMEKQTERLANLTAALLTLSRADAGVLAFDMRNVPVRELLDASLSPVMPLLEEKGQRVRILGEKNLPDNLAIRCDLGWMSEALGNLLKNASEHAPEESEVCISVWDNPVFTGISVEDEGPGFSKEELPHVFERFYRGASAHKDSAGIGLALAKTLIEAQKGEIRAENRKDGKGGKTGKAKGARFLIKFYKNI
ncbi:MAG: HAMP domain-containing histidine kinase [Lachnospiraceae bacterium]|nr:HAMP domain-containing histidine kinase [Lachnospiraceae bacterium]